MNNVQKKIGYVRYIIQYFSVLYRKWNWLLGYAIIRNKHVKCWDRMYIKKIKKFTLEI